MNRIFFRKRRIPSSIILDSFIQNKWIEWLFDIGFCLSEDDSVPHFVEWNLCHWIISTDRDKSSGSRVRGQPITSNSLIRSTFRDHHLQSTIEWVPTRTRRVIWSIRSGNVSPDDFISSSNITDQQWLSFSIGLNRGDQKCSFHWIESSSLSLSQIRKEFHQILIHSFHIDQSGWRWSNPPMRLRWSVNNKHIRQMSPKRNRSHLASQIGLNSEMQQPLALRPSETRWFESSLSTSTMKRSRHSFLFSSHAERERRSILVTRRRFLFRNG
jgi:hypothetical protein